MNVNIRPPRWTNRGIVATVLVGPSFNALAGSALDATIPAISKHYGGGGHGMFLAQLVLVAPGLFIILGSPTAGGAGPYAWLALPHDWLPGYLCFGGHIPSYPAWFYAAHCLSPAPGVRQRHDSY